ncbi:MAG: hypothetical protein WAN23_01430 [Candidatus Acidiferrales bacterium]
MGVEPKRVISWLLATVGFVGVALSYVAIWVLTTTFAAGIVWYANVALVVSGPASGIGAAIAYRRPRQKLALAFGLIGLALWIILWVVCFTVLGFRIK